jgi:hypothetical protein
MTDPFGLSSRITSVSCNREAFRKCLFFLPPATGSQRLSLVFLNFHDVFEKNMPERSGWNTILFGRIGRNCMRPTGGPRFLMERLFPARFVKKITCHGGGIGVKENVEEWIDICILDNPFFFCYYSIRHFRWELIEKS